MDTPHLEAPWYIPGAQLSLTRDTPHTRPKNGFFGGFFSVSLFIHRLLSKRKGKSTSNARTSKNYIAARGWYRTLNLLLLLLYYIQRPSYNILLPGCRAWPRRDHAVYSVVGESIVVTPGHWVGDFDVDSAACGSRVGIAARSTRSVHVVKWVYHVVWDISMAACCYVCTLWNGLPQLHI